MEQLNTAILSERDLETYMDLKELIDKGWNNDLFIKPYDSINSSLDMDIYPTIYLEEAREAMKRKKQITIDRIKQLKKQYDELLNLNSGLETIIEEEGKKNNIRLFDSINIKIKDKVDEEKYEDILLVTYEMYDGKEYRAVVEADITKLLKNIKRVLNIIIDKTLEVEDEEAINDYLEDTLFAVQTYYRFSEYVRYIDFTMYNKDINILKLYEKYAEILLKLKDCAFNRINYINAHKRNWKKQGINIKTDEEIIRRLYEEKKEYIFTKEEVLQSIYQKELEKVRSI